MKIIMIEGARNVGKTYFINNINIDISKYKFPFAKYYNESFIYNYINDSNVNSKKELFYLTLGYDITILDLAKQGLLKEDIIVDRGILSNLVFGVQSGRINLKEATEAWEYLLDEYGEFFNILYVYTNKNIEDNRHKDMWGDLYSVDDTLKLYEYFIYYKDRINHKLFFARNMFDDISLDNFNNQIKLITNKKDNI